MNARLSIDFPSIGALLEWFEEVHDKGLLGTRPEPDWADKDPIQAPDGHVVGSYPRQPRPDIGVRRLDALDLRRVGMGDTFIVASRRDGGKFLRTESISETVVVEE